MGRERMRTTRGKTVNTSIAGHRALRNGVIHSGAVALMLGAALAMNTARAADNDVDDAAAQPAPPLPPRAPGAAVPSPAPASPSAHAAPPLPPAPGAPKASARTRD